MDIVGDSESNLSIGIIRWRVIESSMSFVSSRFSDDDAMIRCIRATYSSLIRFDDRTGNDDNGFFWGEVDDEPNGYIDKFNGSGGMMDTSLLFTKYEDRISYFNQNNYFKKNGCTLYMYR